MRPKRLSWLYLVHLAGSGDSFGPFGEPSRICHSFTENAVSVLSAVGVNPMTMRVVDPLELKRRISCRLARPHRCNYRRRTKAN